MLSPAIPLVRRRSQINAYSVALLLLCVANVLDLFVPRRDDSNYFVRMPIQLINGFLLLFMWLHLFVRHMHWTPVTRTVAAFVGMVCGYAVVYFYQYDFVFSDVAPYLKLLLWTTSIIFFYEMMLRYGLDTKLMALFIFTFLAATAKKMLEASLYKVETLGGGDTAALPLLLIMPVILLCVSGRFKLLVMAIVTVMILVSLRRTVILGLVLILPFVYQYLKARIRTFHIFLFACALAAMIIYAWSFIGEAVFYRFQNLFTGDAGGTKDSFGSGRSEFYKTVWDSWTGTDLQALVFGHGLNSAHELLMRVHNVQHSHNDFLEIGHSFGLVGFTIWLYFLRVLWKLKNQIRRYSPDVKPLFYICFISYLVIGLASGSIMRITTLSFAFSISLLLYSIRKGKMVEQLLQQNRAKEPSVEPSRS